MKGYRITDNSKSLFTNVLVLQIVIILSEKEAQSLIETNKFWKTKKLAACHEKI